MPDINLPETNPSTYTPSGDTIYIKAIKNRIEQNSWNNTWNSGEKKSKT